MAKVIEFNYKAVIVLKLPDGINYYCGKTKDLSGNWLDTWNTEIEQAILYLNKSVAKKRVSVLKRSKGQEDCKLKDYNRLPQSVKDQRNNFLNNNSQNKNKN
jgi:hypothetical protein